MSHTSGSVFGSSPRRRHGIRVATAPLSLALLALISSSACIWGTDRDYLAEQDPVPLVLQAVEPAPGSEGVSRTPRIRFVFDQRIHPDALGADTAWLSAGAGRIGGSRRLDYLDCAVELTPLSPLAADLRHQAVVEGLWSVENGRLAEAVTTSFVTGDQSEAATPLAPPGFATLHAEILAPRCSHCHGGHLPPAGLDLGDATVAREHLVARDAFYHDGFSRVAPGRHASSYLMWKLLGLRGIWGEPMPPPGEGDWPADRGCGTADPDLRRIAGWIDALPTEDGSP